MGLSERFKQLTAPFIAQQDEHGIEIFYNDALTPWCRLTGDLQVANPSTVGFETVILSGLRVKMIY